MRILDMLCSRNRIIPHSHQNLNCLKMLQVNIDLQVMTLLRNHLHHFSFEDNFSFDVNAVYTSDCKPSQNDKLVILQVNESTPQLIQGKAVAFDLFHWFAHFPLSNFKAFHFSYFKIFYVSSQL